MKRFEKIVVACAVLLTLFFFGACSDGTTDGTAKTDDSTPATPENTPTISDETNLNGVASLKVGVTVTYDGAEYLVTENTLSETDISASAKIAAFRAASDEAVSVVEESDTVRAENATYIEKYLKKDARAQF